MRSNLLPLFFALVAMQFSCKPMTEQDSNRATAAAGAGDYRIGERLPQSTAPAAPAAYKEVTWEALMPKNWDPEHTLKGLDLQKLDDGDPRAMAALQRLRDAWDNAPVEPTLNGARIRIPGFLVPLEGEHGQLTEFLLVPYFGACIHSPAPPANQTIHVFPTKPVENTQMMEAIWVSGTLETTGSTTLFGNSGYRMKAEFVTPNQK